MIRFIIFKKTSKQIEGSERVFGDFKFFSFWRESSWIPWSSRRKMFCSKSLGKVSSGLFNWKHS
jgi:hypothetical protein